MKDMPLKRHLIHSEKMSAMGLLASGIIHEINNSNSFMTFNLPILRAYLEKIFAILESHTDTVNRYDWFGMDYPGFRREVTDLLDNLSHGADRISRIVSNLTDVNHPQSADHGPLRADLRDVMSKAVTLCRNEVNKHAKLFEVQFPPEPTWVNAASEALEQVLINLLINAVQAIDKPESWISLRTRIPGNPDEPAVIEVSDNGCGIAPADLGRIFDPFYTTKAPGIGTGLGLTVSHGLILQMGGRMEVQSIPGQRTTFSIYLDLAPASAQDPMAADMESQRPPP